jgi:hypothetical protein
MSVLKFSNKFPNYALVTPPIVDFVTLERMSHDPLPDFSLLRE